MGDTKSPSRVVCAAIRKDGILITGARHFDMVMHNLIEKLPYEHRYFADAEQGFIDQYGEFLTRGEAYDLAKKNGQFIGQPNSDRSLFSEDLY